MEQLRQHDEYLQGAVELSRPADVCGRGEQCDRHQRPAVANVSGSRLRQRQSDCAVSFQARYTEVGTATVTAHTLYNEDPRSRGMASGVRFTVPPTANSSQTGVLTVAEYGSPATYREITLSPTACDFRPNDVSGNNGPLARAGSNQVTITFGIGATSTPTLARLTAGATYYLNVRNFYAPGNYISCPSLPGRCDASARMDLPR
jgi:hypothetical protein